MNTTLKRRWTIAKQYSKRSQVFKRQMIKIVLFQVGLIADYEDPFSAFPNLFETKQKA
jgi:hypothetical protein